MPHTLNGDYFHTVIHSVNDPIISNTDAVGILPTLQFATTGGARFARETLHGIQDTALRGIIKFSQVLFR